MKRLTLLLALALLLWAGSTASADNCCQGGGPGRHMNQQMAPMGPKGPMAPRMHGMMQGMMRGGMMRDGGGMQHLLAMADELKLTEQQRDKLRQMFTDFRMERIDHEADLKKARLRLGELMRDDKAQEADVNRAIDDLARLRADLQKAQYAHRQAVLSVLTDKQRDQLKSMRMDRMRGMRGSDNGDDEYNDEMDEGHQAPSTPDQAIPPYRPRRGGN